MAVIAQPPPQPEEPAARKQGPFASFVVRDFRWLWIGTVTPGFGQRGQQIAHNYLVYLLTAFPLGLAYFIVLAVGASVGAALAVLVVGLGILLATLVAWRGMAAIERGVARALLGVQIARPPDRRGQRFCLNSCSLNFEEKT